MTINHIANAELQHAVAALRAGELVGMPTETVYGLGADASNPDAVKKIFELKGRPSSHPVIVHISDPKHVARWAREVSPAAQKLADAFWPGPLTLVLKRAASVSDVITGGQDTVAIRVPSHPVAQQLLSAFGGGVAAPSANRFGHVSPTRAEHVREEFGDELSIVLDGDDCQIGLESTIVSCVGVVPHLLRPGSITLSQLQAVVPEVSAMLDHDVPRAPGMLERHYSPRTPVHLVDANNLEHRAAEWHVHGTVAVLAMRLASHNDAPLTWINAGNNPVTYAHNLYANLRTLDKVGAKVILVEAVPADERWDAVRDRLSRAATADSEANAHT